MTTMTRYARERVDAGQAMPSVFEVGRRVTVRQAIEDILLIVDCDSPREWEGQVRYLPL